MTKSRKRPRPPKGRIRVHRDGACWRQHLMYVLDLLLLRLGSSIVASLIMKMFSDGDDGSPT